VVNIEGYNSNIQGVENVMNATLELPELKRIIIASSMLVCKVGYIPKSFNDYTPINLYGQSKVLTEKIVKNYNIDWVIVRPTSIWGPWFREPYFNFFKLVINGLYFNIPKKYSSTKTYGFVTNTCMQIYSIMLASNDKVSHKYFYLGDEIPINITEWANLIRFQLKKPNLITLPKYFLYLGSLFGDYLSKFCKFNKFPLNSFRYKNMMTTNNIIESIQDTNKLLLDNNLITLNDATSITLDWIKYKNI
jgi:nucleoside-diphosphate-sugar epimerase